MTDSTAITVALIGAGSSLIGSVVAAWASIRSHQSSRETGRNVQELVINTNGMKDELLKVTGKAERAKGVLQGRAKVAQEKEGKS